MDKYYCKWERTIFDDERETAEQYNLYAYHNDELIILPYDKYINWILTICKDKTDEDEKYRNYLCDSDIIRIGTDGFGVHLKTNETNLAKVQAVKKLKNELNKDLRRDDTLLRSKYFKEVLRCMDNIIA